MKRLFLLFVLSFPLASASSCTGGSEPAFMPETEATPAESPDEAEATILALEGEWVAAIVDRDTATLDRLLADDFVGTSPTAHYYDKDTAIEDLESGRLDVTSMELDEASANVFGDTAIAFTSQDEVSSYVGGDTSGHYHYTNVWIRRNGEWQVVSSHGTRFDEPH